LFEETYTFIVAFLRNEEFLMAYKSEAAILARVGKIIELFSLLLGK
jgi:hypothetical protein